MSETGRWPITILAVGDIMTGCGYFHSLVGDSIPHVLNDPDRSLLHNEVVNTLNKADLLFGNLECIVSDEFDIERDGIPPRIMGPTASIPMLENAGFDVLNLANNHILDHGPEYVIETTDLLESYGISYIGNPLEERNNVTYSIDGKEVTFEGYYVPDLADEATKERIVSNATESDTRDQLTIVSLHWGVFGTEHMKQPSPEQMAFGKDLIDSGVDIILGHHSHTFQPVERYGGGIIAYSLGNFIFDMWREKNRKSGILKMIIDKENNIKTSIIPTEQIDYQVRFTDGEYIKSVQNTPVEWESTEEYRTVSSRVRRLHHLDVIKQLAMNFHRFPPEYHASTLKRWIKKAKREVKDI